MHTEFYFIKFLRATVKRFALILGSQGEIVFPFYAGYTNDIDLLDKLANVYEKGILTKEEFEEKKQEVLKRL